jgi:hypothetical protein
MPDAEENKKLDDEQPEEVADLEATEGDVASDAPAVDDKAGDAAEEKAENEDGSLDSISGSDDKTVEADDETTSFDDEKTDAAIDEIAAKESDAALAAQDAAAATAAVKFDDKKDSRWKRFWRNKWVRSAILLVILAGISAALATPSSRYFILNTAGVRSSSSLTVIDGATRLPLKGVEVSIGGQQKETDSEGVAKFSDLRLGPTQLEIKQIGFEEVDRKVVIGWGSNPFGNVPLAATGVKYVIEVRDYLSEKPIEGVEATDGQSTAVSDKDGKITLTRESSVVVQDGVSLSKAGYRLEKVTLEEDPEKTTKAALVLARKTVFVSRDSGKYDVVKSDIDGKNREVLLAGTGNENSNISLVSSPDGSRVALVSTRDGKRDSDGFLLSSLVLINTENGNRTTIAEASQIQLIDWVGGTRLVFQQTSSGSSEARYTVVSYNYENNRREQLVSASKFNSVMAVQGVIYYAVAADLSNPSQQTGLFRVNPDGEGKQRLIEDELSTVLRASYNTLNAQDTDGTWYTYDVSKATKSEITTPSSLVNRLYVDNSERTFSLFITQGELKSYDIKASKEASIVKQNGMTYPMHWISASAAVFRVSTGSETANYAVSLAGGEPHKIADVAPTYGFAHAQ